MTDVRNMAEQAVLCAMLLDDIAARKAAEMLDDTMFSREAHQVLFRAMAALVKREEPIDIVTLCDELDRSGDLKRSGGLAYMGSLMDAVPTPLNVEYHARILRERAAFCPKVEP